MKKRQGFQTVLSLAVLGAAFATAGCSSPLRPVPPPSVLRSQYARLTLESLEAEIVNLQASERAEPCDRNPELRAAQMEIAKELDARAEEIAKLLRDAPASDFWKRVPLGTGVIREETYERKPEPVWKEEEVGWAEIRTLYTQLKGTPTHSEWVVLDKKVKGILLDDVFRLKGANYFIDKDSRPGLDAALAAFKACDEASDCSFPVFDEMTLDFLKRIPIYHSYLTALGQLEEGQSSQKKQWLQDLRDWIKNDHTTFEFSPNPTIRRASADRLVLPLRVGNLAGFEQQLAGYIEPVWQSDSLAVKIEWVEEPDPWAGGENPYVFLFHSAAGSRPFVRPAEREIHLFSDIRSRSVGHEIGHVLGFPDHYFTVWRPEACSYRQQIRLDDVMSDSASGSVTPEEWKDLDENYPVRKES